MFVVDTVDAVVDLGIELVVDVDVYEPPVDEGLFAVTVREDGLLDE